jgi:hypothetical protein
MNISSQPTARSASCWASGLVPGGDPSVADSYERDCIANPRARDVAAYTPPHLSRGPLLQIRVENQRHRVTVPFDERSRGFVWFFSFLASFSRLEETATQPLILLLDEPRPQPARHSPGRPAALY